MKDLFLFFAVFFLAGCTHETHYSSSVPQHPFDPAIITTEKTVSENCRVIEELKVKWRKEFVMAEGSAPVIKKYDNDFRNHALARRGAILDASRNLAKKVSSTKITENSTMSDFATTDVVQSHVNTHLSEIEVVSESYNTSMQSYEVNIQIPKYHLIELISKKRVK